MMKLFGGLALLTLGSFSQGAQPGQAMLEAIAAREAVFRRATALEKEADTARLQASAQLCPADEDQRNAYFAVMVGQHEEIVRLSRTLLELWQNTSDQRDQASLWERYRRVHQHQVEVDQMIRTCTYQNR